MIQNHEMNTFIQKFGIHPLTAIGMIIIDMMLFGSDITGIGWGISCAVAGVLTIPCILLQKFAYKDNWGTAAAKGLIIGLLTAIPTALPSVATGSSGVLGIIGTLKGITHQQDDSPSEE